MSGRTCMRREHPSRFILDRMACGDIGEEDKKKLRLHMDTCSECSTYFETVTDGSLRVTHRYPQFSDLQKQYRFPKNPATSGVREALLSFFTPLRSLLAFGACAVLCLVVYFGAFDSSDPRLSVKGQPQWFLYSQGTLFSNSDKVIKVGSGDSLQLLMRISSPVYYHLLYRDDNNPIQRYCCDESKILETTEDGAKVSLPFSIVLDSLWQRQTLFCIASSGPLKVKDAERLIAEQKNIEDLEDIWIHTFHLYNGVNE